MPPLFAACFGLTALAVSGWTILVGRQRAAQGRLAAEAARYKAEFAEWGAAVGKLWDAADDEAFSNTMHFVLTDGSCMAVLPGAPPGTAPRTGPGWVFKVERDS